TRTEELILLAVWRLKESAYSVSIHEEISKLSGKEWSLGSIYMPLERLVKRRLLQTYLSEYTPERGGRHKRIYELTKDGMLALDTTRELQDKVWDGVPRFNVKEGN
ncbi:MAG: hypothetical protein GY863_24515, partial [bacterium]|nr:hypothetical protein [bacterium]